MGDCQGLGMVGGRQEGVNHKGTAWERTGGDKTVLCLDRRGGYMNPHVIKWQNCMHASRQRAEKVRKTGPERPPFGSWLGTHKCVVLLLNINKLPGSQPQTRSPQSSETKRGHFIIVSKQPTKARLLCHPPNPKHPPPLAQMSDCRCFTNDSFILVACLPFLEIRSEISRHRIVPAFWQQPI